jgi:DNA-directed RNA polymerase sigma subunit (sigma70/sigma32)
MDLYMAEVKQHPLLDAEQEILSMRFGLNGSEDRTLQQIADALHISRERVRQIEARVPQRLGYATARHELLKIRAQILPLDHPQSARKKDRSVDRRKR